METEHTRGSPTAVLPCPDLAPCLALMAAVTALRHTAVAQPWFERSSSSSRGDTLLQRGQRAWKKLAAAKKTGELLTPCYHRLFECVGIRRDAVIYAAAVADPCSDSIMTALLLLLTQLAPVWEFWGLSATPQDTQQLTADRPRLAQLCQLMLLTPTVFLHWGDSALADGSRLRAEELLLFPAGLSLAGGFRSCVKQWCAVSKLGMSQPAGLAGATAAADSSGAGGVDGFLAAYPRLAATPSLRGAQYRCSRASMAVDVCVSGLQVLLQAFVLPQLCGSRAQPSAATSSTAAADSAAPPADSALAAPKASPLWQHVRNSITVLHGLVRALATDLSALQSVSPTTTVLVRVADLCAGSDQHSDSEEEKEEVPAGSGLAAFPRSAGPGSIEQAKLYSLLSSLTKAASLGGPAVPSSADVRHYVCLAAVELLHLPPPPPPVAPADTSGSSSSSTSSTPTSTSGAAGSLTQSNCVALQCLPSLLLIAAAASLMPARSSRCWLSRWQQLSVLKSALPLHHCSTPWDGHSSCQSSS